MVYHWNYVIVNNLIFITGGQLINMTLWYPWYVIFDEISITIVRKFCIEKVIACHGEVIGYEVLQNNLNLSKIFTNHYISLKITVCMPYLKGNLNFIIKENNMVRAKIFIFDKYLYTLTKAFGQRCIHHQFYAPTN